MRTYTVTHLSYLMFAIPQCLNTYINIQWCISQTQQNFIMFITVLGKYISILIELSSGPSKIQILTYSHRQQNFIMFNIVLGQHVSILIESSSGSVFLEGSEDDCIRIETCCPNTIINIIKFCCVWLIHHCIFIYIFLNLWSFCGHFEKTKETMNSWFYMKLTLPV